MISTKFKLILLLVALVVCKTKLVAQQKSPNIIYILADDLGWADVAFNGSKFYETPNLDKLAKKSFLFKKAYAAAPVCSPTRGSIMSGKYPVNTGFTGLLGQYGKPSKGKLIDADFTPGLASKETTIAEVLKTKAYRTWHIGKWHLGEGKLYSPEEQGFDSSFSGFEVGKWKHKRFRKSDNKFITDHLTDKALSLIEENKQTPFYLNLWYYAVHTPIVAKKKDIAYFKAKAKKMGLDTQKTFNVSGVYPSVPWFMKSRDGQKIKRRISQNNPSYAAFVYCLDQNIGRIIEKLETLKMMENTMLVFFSDNGGLSSAEGSPTSNWPLREGKGWMYEGAYRVPMFVYYSKLNIAPKTIETPVMSIDFLPTIAEVAGVNKKYLKDVDGLSLLPLIKGTKKLNRKAIYWHSPHYFNQGGHPYSAIREGNFKYVYSYETEKEELFDLLNDISEKNNLAIKMPKKAKMLKRKLKKWLRQSKALYPQKNSKK